MIESMCRLLIFALVLSVAASAGEFRVGRGAARITPPAGMPMGGGFTIRLSTGVHDDLFCKSLVFEKDGRKAGMVTCDVESLHRPTVEAARRIISRSTGLRGEQVMITATHSHSGPEMTPLVLEGAEGETARIVREYHEALPGKIAEAVRAAEANLRPARVRAATAQENAISFNRRYLMKNGSVVTNPGQMNPEIVRPAGPIDPELKIVYFDAPEGTPLAAVANFALHTTAWGGSDFSSDYPGVLAERLAAVQGSDFFTLFLQGCSGNINQVDVRTHDRQFGPAQSARIATILAADVLKSKPHAAPLDPSAVEVRSAYVDLPVPDYSPAQVQRAHEIIAESRRTRKGGPKFLEVVDAFRILNVAEYHAGKPIHAEVQVIALGDELAWVGLPGEVFTELGMALKKASPFRHTVVNELANNMLDYVPNRKAYPEGSYEPTTARCLPGCGEMLIDAATQLLVDTYRELHPASAR